MFGETWTSSGAIFITFGTARTLAGPIQNAKTERVGVRGLEPLIGCVLLAHWLCAASC